MLAYSNINGCNFENLCTLIPGRSNEQTCWTVHYVYSYVYTHLTGNDPQTGSLNITYPTRILTTTADNIRTHIGFSVAIMGLGIIS